MPFKSESQRRYLFAEEPEVAEKWASEYPTHTKLPMHVKKKAKRQALLKHMRAKVKTQEPDTTKPEDY